jgi:hypothetical protein
MSIYQNRNTEEPSNVFKINRKLLRLKGLLVRDFQFRFTEGQLNLSVKRYKNWAMYPKCELGWTILQTMTKLRVWR